MSISSTLGVYFLIFNPIKTFTFICYNKLNLISFTFYRNLCPFVFIFFDLHKTYVLFGLFLIIDYFRSYLVSLWANVTWLVLPVFDFDQINVCVCYVIWNLFQICKCGLLDIAFQKQKKSHYIIKHLNGVYLKVHSTMIMEIVSNQHLKLFCIDNWLFEATSMINGWVNF